MRTSTSIPMPPRAAISLVAQVMPGAAQVLDAGDQPRLVQGQAGLDQPLLLERVADLDAGPLGLVALSDRRSRPTPARSPRRCRRGRWWTRGARPGCRPPRPGPAPGARGGGRRRPCTLTSGLSAKQSAKCSSPPTVGHADRVAVAGDAADHAFDHPAAAGVVQGPEVERVEQGDGAGAHGEDVAEDAADARWPPPGRARWPTGGCGSRCGPRPRCPSPPSTTPAFSPGPTRTHGASDGRRPRWTRDDLYEQCSDHMTAYMASSSSFGDRPRISSMRAASSSVSPRARWMGCDGVAVGTDGPPCDYRTGRDDEIGPFRDKLKSARRTRHNGTNGNRSETIQGSDVRQPQGGVGGGT